VKLLSKNEEQIVFQLTETEDVFLRLALSAFPVGGEGWPQGGGEPVAPPDPGLLSASLMDLRREQASRVQEFLRNQPVAPDGSPGRLLRVGLDEVDWLLQVLNEVRVGSWYALGCPDEVEEEKARKSSESVSHLIRYDFSGWMQAVLLAALEQP
jgi:hypothetical protein